MYVKKVRKSVALNPIAQAVARAKLREEITTAQIKLFTMQAGDDCSELIKDITTTLTIVGIASELDPTLGAEHPGVRVLRGALSACHQLAPKYHWAPLQATAIDQGLRQALDLVRRLKAPEVNQAIHITLNPQGETTRESA